MRNENEIISRCPLWDTIFSFIISVVVLINTTSYSMRINTVDDPVDKTEVEEIIEEQIQETIVVEEVVEIPVLKSDDEIISEINDEKEPIQTETLQTETPTMTHTYTSRLTKRGGVYNNPYTGLKETWYSQRVLPGGGLKIPGRHVNDEGFVCDKDGYICVASSTYPKGTVIETSRGIGKVYDSGCKPGILDLYVDW